MEKVAAWDIVVVRVELSLCCKQGSVSYDPLHLSNISSFSSPSLTLCFVWQLWKFKSSCKPAFCWPAGSMARTRSARTLQLYVYHCLSICSICHMPVPEVSWEEDPFETKLFHQNLSVPSYFLALLLRSFLLVIYYLLPSSML